jgi:AraC-like DNA-binding protein
MNYYQSSDSDPFSEVIRLLRPHAAVSKPISGRGRWGVRYAAYNQPGFAVVLAGRCWLAVEGMQPVALARGDFVLLPSTPAFALYSDPRAKRVLREPSNSAVRHGEPEGEPDFQMLGGAFRIESVNAPLLPGLLPAMIHVRSADGGTGRLAATIGLIMDECAANRPGRDTITERLLEIMLVECLRMPGNTQDALPPGLLAAMQDTALADVLRLVHADIRTRRTVAELARHAGMSRSAFAARFSERLGCAPMEYIARWRITLAQDALSRGGTSLDRLAEDIGYESASAFSTAFRRRVGCSPGTFARLRAGETRQKSAS